MDNILIDFETLGAGDNAVLCTMGAVAFNNDTPADFQLIKSNGFYQKFDIKKQIADGRVIDKDVSNWWQRQSKEAFNAAITPSNIDVELSQGIHLFNNWCNTVKYKANNTIVWCRRSHFDFPKLEHAFKYYQITPVVKHWDYRDSLTFLNVLTGDRLGYVDINIDNLDVVVHNALDDCVLEAMRMLTAIV